MPTPAFSSLTEASVHGYTVSQVLHNILCTSGTFSVQPRPPHISVLSSESLRDKTQATRWSRMYAVNEQTQRLYAALQKINR